MNAADVDAASESIGAVEVAASMTDAAGAASAVDEEVDEAVSSRAAEFEFELEDDAMTIDSVEVDELVDDEAIDVVVAVCSTTSEETVDVVDETDVDTDEDVLC